MEKPVKTLADTWRQMEWEREKLFRTHGPFFHLHTPSKEDGVIFKTAQERSRAIVFIALSAEENGVVVLAYALMSNHFHFILRGSEPCCQAFYQGFRLRLGNYFSRHGRPGENGCPRTEITPITTLKQFRNEVVYVIRNPFVVRRDINPLAYPWTTGFLYFNPLLRFVHPVPVETLYIRQQRELLSSKDLRIPKGLSTVDGDVYPASFVNYRLVESLFLDARQFTMAMFKNVEAQVETALRLGERPSLTDEDLLPVAMRLCEELSGQNTLSALTEAQKNDLARRLKYDYHASNKQVARFSGLPLARVNALFPLSAK